MLWNLYVFDTLDSTNTKAREYAPFSAVMAHAQSAGRGRCGRVWQSLAGNLNLSLVLPAYDNQNAPLLSFVAGVAVARALAPFPVRLKWPNDVLFNGKKLAGILLERTDDKIIVGIGVNVQQAPQGDLNYAATSLNGAVTAESVCQKILEEFEKTLAVFNEKGFEPIREEWKNLAAGLNEEIKVKLPLETIYGLFADITPSGAIDLTLNNQTHRLVTAGDVFLVNEGKKNE